MAGVPKIADDFTALRKSAAQGQTGTFSAGDRNGTAADPNRPLSLIEPGNFWMHA